MHPTWAKAFRDLRLYLSRSVLAILGIAIGIIGFGSVLSTYAILSRELNAGYLATNPASATLTLDRADDALLQSVRSFPGIDAAEVRGSLTGRVRAGDNEWRNAILFVIPDYSKIQISTINPEKGAWPPKEGEILIERDAMGVAHASIGQDITLRLPDGRQNSLHIAGTVHDVGQAQARMEQIVYGYITTNTLGLLGEKPNLDELKILVNGNRLDAAHVRDVTLKLKVQLEKEGHVVSDVDIPKPGRHPHADLMGAMLLFQSSFGFFALLLSGLLVVNVFTALMAGQIRQIGIMKTLGATSRRIRRIYFSEVLLLGVAALLVSIPITVFGARALSTMLATFLNFDILTFAIPFWVFAAEITVGLCVPLLAAIFPVRRGSRITILDAMGDYGVRQSAFGTALFDRIVGRLPGLGTALMLSFRNTFRRRERLLLTLIALTTGGAIFMAALNVRASFVHTINLMFQTTKYDLSVGFAEAYPADQVLRVVRNIPGIEIAEAWQTNEASLVAGNGSPSGHSVGLVAAPSNSKMIVYNLIEGRALRAGDEHALLINNRFAQMNPSVHVGSSIRLNIGGKSPDWQVVGVVRQAFAAPAAYADFNYLSTLTDRIGKKKSVRIITSKQDGDFMADVMKRLDQELDKAGFRTTSVTSMSDRRKVIDEHNSIIYLFLLIMSFLIVAVGGAGLMTLMSISVLERTREIGVLRSVGARRKTILLMVMAEGSFIAALAWALAVIPGRLISTGLGNLVAGMMLKTDLDFAFDSTGILIWLAIMLVFGAVASALPAWNAARLTVRQAIDYE